jgi:hypothetical protein
MLVETARAIAPQLTIVDGIMGHEGNGPSGGEPRALGLLGASSDVFALDRALVEILQIDPTQGGADHRPISAVRPLPRFRRSRFRWQQLEDLVISKLAIAQPNDADRFWSTSGGALYL